MRDCWLSDSISLSDHHLLARVLDWHFRSLVVEPLTCFSLYDEDAGWLDDSKIKGETSAVRRDEQNLGLLIH